MQLRNIVDMGIDMAGNINIWEGYIIVASWAGHSTEAHDQLRPDTGHTHAATRSKYFRGSKYICCVTSPSQRCLYSLYYTAAHPTQKQ